MSVGVLLVAACLWAMADDAATVNSVVAAVRTSIRKKHRDPDLAAALNEMKLSERLDDRVLEILESEGAGPQSLGALQRLRDASRELPPPRTPPPGMEPPPAPSRQEEYRMWEETGIQARDYVNRLPDFICAETIHRWYDPTSHEAWQPAPTVAAELTYFDRQEKYQSVTVGGRASDRAILDVGGAMSQGEFGTLLRSIFNPMPDTFYRFDHWTVLRKRPTYVYLFRIAASHAPNVLRSETPGGAGPIETVAGQRGYIYIDRDTYSVTRIVAEAVDIPAGFPVQKSKIVLDYDYADIGGRSFLLPLRAEVRIDSGQVQNLNSVEFHKYRKYSSDTAIQFGDKK